MGPSRRMPGLPTSHGVYHAATSCNREHPNSPTRHLQDYCFCLTVQRFLQYHARSVKGPTVLCRTPRCSTTVSSRLLGAAPSAPPPSISFAPAGTSWPRHGASSRVLDNPRSRSIFSLLTVGSFCMSSTIWFSKHSVQDGRFLRP